MNYSNEINSPLRGIARARSYKRRRESSWDRTGGNKDSVRVSAGETFTAMNVEGAGMISHIWCTINSQDRYALRKILIRMYWDGEEEPSVDVPLGDFFGMGFARTANFTSLPLVMASQEGKGMNCYFPMPFTAGARIEFVNDCDVELHALYFYIDYELHRDLDAGWLRFHAQWRRENPTVGWGDESREKTVGLNLTPTEYGREIWKTPNLRGEGNYVILEAEGRGHYVGCNLNIDRFTHQKNMWYGEGDDMIFIDGDEFPTINGTGTEDYFNMAWAPREEHSSLYHGLTLIESRDWRGKNSMYRFHIEDPICFEKSIRVTIEHGHANNLSNDYSSTAYWYQTEPHKLFPPIPKATDREPRID